jgi:hypothetical protein
VGGNRHKFILTYCTRSREINGLWIESLTLSDVLENTEIGYLLSSSVPGSRWLAGNLQFAVCDICFILWLSLDSLLCVIFVLYCGCLLTVCCV